MRFFGILLTFVSTLVSTEIYQPIQVIPKRNTMRKQDVATRLRDERQGNGLKGAKMSLAELPHPISTFLANAFSILIGISYFFYFV